MSTRAALELSRDVIRAFQAPFLPGGSPASVEVPWDPERPDEAIQALRKALGTPSSVRVVIGIDFLEVKRVHLPPAPAGERARMIALSPERYFAQGGAPLVTCLLADSSLAFATERSRLESWIAALEAWARVDWVEPAPLSLARALVRNPPGVVTLRGQGIIAMIGHRAGRIVSARIMPATEPAPVDPGDPNPSEEVAELDQVRGALRDPGPLPHEMLAPEAWKLQWRRRRRSRLAAVTAAACLSVLLLAWSVVRYRERTLSSLDRRLAALAPGAALVDTALRVLQSRETELMAVRSASRINPDPLGALVALGLVLPSDAVVRSIKVSGDAWEVEGVTPNAATIVPRLDADGRFDSVRVLSATSRFREGNRSWETFSIAFRYRPTP